MKPFARFLPCLLLVSALAVAAFAAPSVPPACEQQLQLISTGALQPSAIVDIVSQFSCFSEVANQQGQTIVIQRASLKDVLAAARKQTNTANQQQGASVGSSATTTPVSKVGGPSSIMQEFGGVSETASGSSTTFQFAPGTVISSLTSNELVPLCNPSLIVDKHCIDGFKGKLLMPITLGITANTSSSSQSLTATATPGGSGKAQPVNVTSNGTVRPTFGGISVKYAFPFWANEARAQYSPDYSKTAVSATDLLKYLGNVNAYNQWQLATTIALQKVLDSVPKDQPEARLEALTNSFSAQYPLVFSALDIGHSIELRRKFSGYLADTQTIYAARLLTAAAAEVTNSSIPHLGAEYDLSTPQNQPAYSTYKLNFSYQFPTKTNKASTETAATGKDTSKELAIAGTAATGKSTASSTAPPFTISAMFGASSFNSQPSSSIPSASLLRDIQAGAEISYLCHTSSTLGWVGSIIGDTTLAGAYYYQDQTSPSILNGLPSTITFTGLPSTASQVYTKRGVINLAQLRLGFGSGSNVSFPVSATYSNRTELITHPTWGLQFGLSYNLSSLFASAGTSNTK
jgi:hypothetical protein